jgi:ribosomal protein S10
MPTATKRVRQNGRATEAMDVTPAAGPRLPRDEEWWDVEGVPDFTVRLWVNFSTALFRRAIGVDATAEQQREALQQIVLEHNGWLDEDGKPYPAADDDGFYEALPRRLILRLVRTIGAARDTLPNFQMPTRRT